MKPPRPFSFELPLLAASEEAWPGAQRKDSPRPRQPRILGLLALLALLSACGGGESVTPNPNPPPPPPPPPAPVATVAVTPDSSDVAIGSTTHLVATAKDAAGNLLPGRSVAWSVSNPAVATVSATGLVTAVVPGRVTLTALMEGKSGTAVVRSVAIGDTLPGSATSPGVTAIPLQASPPLVPTEFTPGAPSLPKAAVSHTTALLLISPDATLAQLNALLRLVHGRIVGGSPGVAGQVPGILVVRLPTTSHADMAAALSLLRQQAIVLQAQPDLRLSPLSIPAPNTLPSIYQWTWETKPGTANWGLEAIRAPQLWSLNESIRRSGNRTVTAVFDVGFFASEDLVYEQQFASNYMKTHGTHVAGIIAAAFNNGKGIDGVNPFTRLVSAGGFETMSALVTDFRIFLDSVPTARVVNLSMGYNTGANQINTTTDVQAQQRADGDGDFVTAVLRAIAAARPLPILVVSAGNDSDDFPNQQARYASPYANAALRGAAPIIVVEAVENNFTTGNQFRADFSNLGGHVSAPGAAILSTVGGTDYDLLNGTSQAAPFVAGLVSYLLALDPTLPAPTMTSNPVRDLLIQTAAPIAGAAPLIDAFAAAMEVDRQQSNDKVLRALLDIDDGSLDGNTRVGPNASSEDVDGNGGQGDGNIDMSDFRRWRDWFVQLGADPGLQLDGPATHLKRDLNGDGLVETPAKEGVFPRGDFNGDGRIDLLSDAPMMGALAGQRFTDLDVLRARFVDPHYHETTLPNLVHSGDITIDATPCFNRPGVAAVLTEIQLANNPGMTIRARIHRASDGLQEFTEHIDGAGHRIVVSPLDAGLTKTGSADSRETVLQLGSDFLYTPCALPPACGRVVNGTLNISTTTDLANAADVVEVTGDVSIFPAGPNAVTSVDLPCLKKARAVSIQSSPGVPVAPTLTSVRLSSLESIGLSISVFEQPTLARLELPALQTTGLHVNVTRSPAFTQLILGPASLGHQLGLVGNASLTSLAGISGGLSVAVLQITSNPQLCQSELDALRARITIRQTDFSSGKAGC